MTLPRCRYVWSSGHYPEDRLMIPERVSFSIKCQENKSYNKSAGSVVVDMGTFHRSHGLSYFLKRKRSIYNEIQSMSVRLLRVCSILPLINNNKDVLIRKLEVLRDVS